MVTKPFEISGAWGGLGSWGTGEAGVWGEGSSEMLASHPVWGAEFYGQLFPHFAHKETRAQEEKG